RMELLEATGADIGLLFMLASDPGGELGRATAPAGAPIAEGGGLKGGGPRLWGGTAQAAVGGGRRRVGARPRGIPGGGHPCEAVAYAERHREATHKLMTFFALEAPGLTILPNHRLVHGVQPFDFDDFVQMASRWFDVSPLADPLGVPLENRTIAVVGGPDAAL